MVIYANDTEITNEFYEEEDYRKSFTELDVEKGTEANESITITASFPSGMSSIFILIKPS